MAVRFDRTINTGTLIQIVIMLLALWGATVRLEGRLATLETKIDPMWQWFTRYRIMEDAR